MIETILDHQSTFTKNELGHEVVHINELLDDLNYKIWKKNLNSIEIEETFEESFQELDSLRDILIHVKENRLDWQNLVHLDFDKKIMGLYSNIDFINYWAGFGQDKKGA